MEAVFEYLNGAPMYILIAVIAVAGVAVYNKMKNKDGTGE